MGINRKRLINVLGSRLREKFQEEIEMKVRKILVVLAATFLIGGTAVGTSFAQQDTLLNGIYQCLGAGFVVPIAAGSDIPFDSIGNLVANGAGLFTVSTPGPSIWTFTVDGFPFQQVALAAGSAYEIQPDGTGTAQLNFAQAILSAVFGGLIFQGFGLGVNTIVAGVAQQFTMIATPNEGPGISTPEFPNVWQVVCNHQ